ncbi:MAG: LysR family transcriptional regulator [Alphaproteobacteria bacterium]|nr:LysR family transcriptional regulator [Alphaproteobacteria bacterium]MDX5368030.1 LysR family transcriptional regulator [Alphaproteobacteria bacterium]
MTFDQLLTFLWVARLGGMRRAAEQMNLSQPAISARLSALEDSLRVKLFERTPRGVALTRAGELLRTYAEQMVFVREEILSRVANPAGIDRPFRIGCSETIAQSWLPDFLQRFSDRYPGVTLELTIDISLNLREGLMSHQFDLSFLMGPVSDYQVKNVALPKFPLRWYRKTGTESDLRRVPVISYSRQTRPYRELSSELSRRYGPGVRVYSSASLSTSLKMIAAGTGVGPFPEALARELVAAGEIEEFDPGWAMPALDFTASYLAEPRDFLAEEAADLAAQTGHEWSERMAILE